MEGAGFGEARGFLGRDDIRPGGVGVCGTVPVVDGGERVVRELSFLDGIWVGGHSCDYGYDEWVEGLR